MAITRSEAVNIADKYPDKLRELQLLFYAEAAKYNVLPLDDSGTERMDPAIRPSLTRGRTEFTYFGTVTRIPEGAAPNIKNKSFRITADVVLPIRKYLRAMATLLENDLHPSHVMEAVKGPLVIRRGQA